MQSSPTRVLRLVVSNQRLPRLAAAQQRPGPADPFRVEVMAFITSRPRLKKHLKAILDAVKREFHSEGGAR